MHRSLIPPVLILLLLAACVNDDPRDIQRQTLDCTFEVVAPDGSSQADRAAIVFLPGGGAVLSLSSYEANIYVEEVSGQEQLALRFEIVGPDEYRVMTVGETDAFAAPGTPQGAGSGQPGNGDLLTWECVTQR